MVKRGVIGILVCMGFAAFMSPALAQEQTFTVSFLGSSEIPAGIFENNNAFGFGGFLQMNYPVTRRIGVGSTIGFLNFGAQDWAKETLLVIFIGKTPRVNMIPILATGQYLFSPAGQVKPYLKAGLGLYHLGASSVDTLYNAGDRDGDGVVGADEMYHYTPQYISQTRAGGMLGGGVLVTLTPERWWFEVQGGYHLMTTKRLGIKFRTTFLYLGLGVSRALGRAQ